MTTRIIVTTLVFFVIFLSPASAAYAPPSPESPFNPDQDWIGEMKEMAV